MEETLKDTESRRYGRDGRPIRQNGPAIRALREKDGWTQAAFAGALSKSGGYLSAIESETEAAPVVLLNRMARVLRVPAGAIMRDWSEDDSDGSEPGEAAEDDEPEAVAAA